MKATLEFTLPEDRYEFEFAQAASKIAAEFYEMGHFMRNIRKHREMGEEASKLFDEIDSAWCQVAMVMPVEGGA